MFTAQLFEEKPQGGLGAYKFTVVPSIGDRIKIWGSPYSQTILEVLYVEHVPTKMPRGDFSGDPQVSICVRTIGSEEFDD